MQSWATSERWPEADYMEAYALQSLVDLGSLVQLLQEELHEPVPDNIIEGLANVELKVVRRCRRWRSKIVAELARGRSTGRKR